MATPALADDAPRVGLGDTLLTVSADGKSTRTPDIARFNAGITTLGQTASAAMAANAAAMTRVMAALKAAGIADRDVQTSSLSLSPIYDNPDRRSDGAAPRITGYRATNNVGVRVRALNALGRVIDTLVGAGANEVNGPNFDLDRPEAAQDEARTAAMTIARGRAELYAHSAGLKVLRILSISESGGFSPRPMAMMSRSVSFLAPPPPPPPVAAGELDVDISITVQFELAPQ